MPQWDYMQEKIGKAVLKNINGEVEAGSICSFDLVYTAGFFGVDDSGSLKIVERFATDSGKPQFIDPDAKNYINAEASNGAGLSYRWDVKNNVRPWGKTLYIKLVGGNLREGESITVHYRNMELQTFCENKHQLKVLVDAFAAYEYVELPESPGYRVTGGAPFSVKAFLPTFRRPGEAFDLSLRVDDRWGNPSGAMEGLVSFTAQAPVKGLPDSLEWPAGESTLTLKGLMCEQEGDLRINIRCAGENMGVETNPLRISNGPVFNSYWGDLHGQSEETIGSNTVIDYFSFARDRAFLDVCCHQGNDFQITKKFWNTLNETTKRFNEPNRYVVFPGYEWSGNTSMGGDHNIIYRNEGEQIYRSSHALVYDLSDESTDRHTTKELFETLKAKDVFVYAHVGGRYADLIRDSSAEVPLAVEIHSAWGTFEWLLFDAFKAGRLVGIVANSDDHKGRPGASVPGRSLFGSYGGYTCFLAPHLTRDGIFDALLERRHYATTGSRIYVDLRLRTEEGREAPMGSLVSSGAAAAVLKLDVSTTSPIERIDIFNGESVVHTWRPYTIKELGKRIKILWQGAEYRGRGRQTDWSGTAVIDGNSFSEVKAVNFWNPERPLKMEQPQKLSWQSITTGGFAGVEAVLAEEAEGTVTIETALINEEIPVAEIGMEGCTFEAGGLDRRLSLYRLPDVNPVRHASAEFTITLGKDERNPIFARITTEDGHRAWTSPVYVET